MPRFIYLSNLTFHVTFIIFVRNQNMANQNVKANRFKEVQPFTYIVRFDIAPVWTADGFILDDQAANNMLNETLGYACSVTELAAKVLVSPEVTRIADAQGYKRGVIEDEVKAKSPLAYADSSVLTTIIEAIELIDSVAFVREETDNSGDVLAKLRKARDLLNGTEPVSGIEWQLPE